MKKFKVRTQLTYVPRVQDLEINSGEVVTVPDEAYTVRELFERSASGLLGDAVKTDGSFVDQDLDAGFDVEKLKHMDLFEREEFLRGIADDIAAKRKALAEAEAANKKKLSEEKAEQLELLKEHRARKAQQKSEQIAERKKEGGRKDD